MESVLLLNKHISQTPLETIKRFRSRFPEYEKTRLGYAGRLDPMAEGLLLVLVGDENRKRKEYEAMKKRYESTMLLGIQTDSFDLLGLPTLSKTPPNAALLKEAKSILSALPGKHHQAYPPYSSKTINGKPLYYYARNNLLHTISLPTHTITIELLTINEDSVMSAKQLYELLLPRIQNVKGDFRQKIILEKWRNLLQQSNRVFPTLSYSITCSSGTYIRSIANEIGEKIGCGALTFSIERTAIGHFLLQDALEA